MIFFKLGISEKKIISICTILSTVIAGLSYLKINPEWLPTIEWRYFAYLGLAVILLIIVRRILKKKKFNKNAKVIIKENYLRSYNEAQINRSFDDTLQVNSITQTFIIEGNNLERETHVKGIMLKNVSHNGYIYTISQDSNIPFNSLNCYAYDIINDPKRFVKIKPILLSENGNFQKLLIPFSNAFIKDAPFELIIYTKTENCMLFGVDYLGVTLSFKSPKEIAVNKVIIKFIRNAPQYVSVYEVEKGQPHFLHNMKIVSSKRGVSIYEDEKFNVKTVKDLIYIFDRI